MRTATRTRANPAQLRQDYQQATTLPKLLACQAAIRQAMNDTSDDLDAGDGEDQAQLQALWTQLQALFSEVGDRILRQAERDEYERRQQGIPIGGEAGDAQWNRRLVEYRITRAIAGSAGQALGTVDWGPERETSQELARRSEIKPTGFLVPLAALSLRVRDCPPHLLRRIEQRQITSTLPAGGPGGALIATVLDPSQYVDALRPAMAVRQLGARVIGDLTANLNLPALTQPTGSAWFAENSPITTYDEQFADIPLRPRHCGAILEVSRNMLQQSTPDIEMVVRDDLAKVLARAVDTAAISGAGTAIEPQGIISDPTTPSLPAAAPSYDGLVDLTGLLATANALDGSLGWLGDANVRSALLKLKDSYARPYGLDLLFQGYPYVFSNLASGSATVTNPIIFGNWNDLVIGMWSELDILTNPYDSAAYSKGNMLLRGACTIDIARRHVPSFAYMSATGVLAAEAEAAPQPPAAPERARAAR